MDSIDTDNNYQITASAQEINKLHAEAEALAKTSKEYASKAIQIALDIGARLVKERFLDAPATIYRLALSQLTGTAFSSPTDSQ